MLLKPGIRNFGPQACGKPELWKDLAFLMPFTDRFVTGRGGLLNRFGEPVGLTPTTSGTLWRNSRYGLGLGSSNSADLRRLLYTGYAPITTSDGAGTGDFSVMILANPRAQTTHGNNGDSMVRQRLATGSFNGTWLSCNASNGVTSSGRLGFFTFDGTISEVFTDSMVDGNWHLFAGVRRGSVMELWRDGVMVASTSPTVRDIYTTTANFCIGGRPDTAANGMHIDDDIGIVSGWNRALLNPEVALLSADPFIMLRRPRPRLVYKAPAAAGADVRRKIIPAYMRIAA